MLNARSVATGRNLHTSLDSHPAPLCPIFSPSSTTKLWTWAIFSAISNFPRCQGYTNETDSAKNCNNSEIITWYNLEVATASLSGRRPRSAGCSFADLS